MWFNIIFEWIFPKSSSYYVVHEQGEYNCIKPNLKGGIKYTYVIDRLLLNKETKKLCQVMTDIDGQRRVKNGQNKTR